MVQNIAGQSHHCFSFSPSTRFFLSSPVAALQRMLAGSLFNKEDSLFQDKFQRGSPLIDSVARKYLKTVSLLLDLPKMLTFHDFRRGGVTWAFRGGVPIQEIQAQGIWCSDCLWRYIVTHLSLFPSLFYFSDAPVFLATHTWHLGLFSPYFRYIAISILMF